jgi:hypothetical protein
MIPALASVNRALMLATMSSHFPFVEPGTMPERTALPQRFIDRSLV